ncbi:unnamed protein product [Cuscuta epithymum]|uniref:Uncharacterized protein n=1 Tax=Cuscuta epithymum TaxID=186058 RepID=A0AAV0DU09_9ASTE|nr:unnamed protein product [Cuscuta epithymum]
MFGKQRFCLAFLHGSAKSNTLQPGAFRGWPFQIIIRLTNLSSHLLLCFPVPLLKACYVLTASLRHWEYETPFIKSSLFLDLLSVYCHNLLPPAAIVQSPPFAGVPSQSVAKN